MCDVREVASMTLVSRVKRQDGGAGLSIDRNSLVCKPYTYRADGSAGVSLIA